MKTKEYNYEKHVMFPLKTPKDALYYQMYKNHLSSFWTVDEVDLTEDISHLQKLNEDEKHYVKHVLAFFAASDGIVNENIACNFVEEFSNARINAFYTFQEAIETIHSEMYSLLIDTYVKDPEEKERLFNAVEHYPAIGKKAKWAFQWMNRDQPLAERLVAFAIIEGVFFSGSFCSIFWLKKRGLLPGLCTANEFISRDEGLHWIFATEVFKNEGLTITKERFKEIMDDAVEHEIEFITDALPVRLIGMNADLMAQYIRYTADRVSQYFGFGKLYNDENPFDFMKLIDLETKSNFFEKRNSVYQRSEERTISFNEDF